MAQRNIVPAGQFSTVYPYSQSRPAPTPQPLSPVSPLPALVVLLIALLTGQMLVRRMGTPLAHGRFDTLDGLRGYLALGVYLHHACIWFFWLREGSWNPPPSSLYRHFGMSGVALFFMVTGFLFFSKVLDGRQRPIDWLRLFVSRVLRLTPLYLFVVAGLFLIVLTLSDGTLRAPALKLLKGMIQWLGFTVLGAPDLNGVSGTTLILAGVTWSLPYEWLFYASLPALALTARVVAPWPYLVLGFAGLAASWFWGPLPQHLLAFLGGIAAAVLVRSERFLKLCATAWASAAVLALLTLAVMGFPSAREAGGVGLLAAAFALIAGGSSLFGLLRLPVSKLLGDMAYSLYLLHGALLFIVFRFLIGAERAAALSSTGHWLVILALTPVLVLLSHLSFRRIEKPALERTQAVTDWLRRRGTRSHYSAPPGP